MRAVILWAESFGAALGGALGGVWWFWVVWPGAEVLSTWSAALPAYAEHQAAQGLARGTMRLHRYYLLRVADQAPSPWRVSVDLLTAFLANPSWRPETRKSARAAVRGFYRWGHSRGLVEVDPSALLPAVRVPAADPRPAPEAVVAALVEDPGRVGLMARLAAYGGLRAGEIARVHGGDLEGRFLVVDGKGGKVRRVPVVDPVILGRLEAVGDAWAFPNGLGGHLSPGHVSRLLSRALPAGWTAHTLRHRMATRAYAGTGDLLALGKVLGHSRPETTQRYVRLEDAKLTAVVAAAS